MEIKKELKDFYNKEAEKYYFTRKKYRSDGNQILKEIEESGKKTISILEFGCGSGRLISFLNEKIKNKKIIYTGVDISENLLKYAQKENPKNNFVCDDISNYIKNLKQESLDFIIGIASFQHIPIEKERIFLIKNFYKNLKYGGKLIMTNRSISEWFIKKHIKVIFKSILKYTYTFGSHNWRDLHIPWKNKNKKYYRFYHMFTISEIYKLTKLGGFKINKLTYVDRLGQEINNRRKSKNTFFVGSKDI